MSADQERLRGYLLRQLAELERVERTARSPVLRATAAEEKRELRARLEALNETEAATA